MRYRLLDLLACPICKRFPLELITLEETTQTGHVLETCEEYCGLLRKSVSEGKGDCKICLTKVVETGILICGGCRRWYPIIGEIPHMLPDELRKAEENKAFLSEWRRFLPDHVLQDGKPFNLSRSRVG